VTFDPFDTTAAIRNRRLPEPNTMRFRQNEAWLDGCGASDELDDWYGGAWFCVVLREGDGVRARVGGMMPSWARRALQNLLVRFVRACWGDAWLLGY